MHNTTKSRFVSSQTDPSPNTKSMQRRNNFCHSINPTKCISRSICLPTPTPKLRMTSQLLHKAYPRLPPISSPPRRPPTNAAPQTVPTPKILTATLHLPRHPPQTARRPTRPSHNPSLGTLVRRCGITRIVSTSATKSDVSPFEISNDELVWVSGTCFPASLALIISQRSKNSSWVLRS